MQKLAALVLAFVLALGFPAGVLAQGDFGTEVGAVSGPISGGGGGGVPMPIAPPASSGGGGFIQPQQIAPLPLGGFDDSFQSSQGASMPAGSDQLCAVRAGGNDVSCFDARATQNLPAGRGPCQPWESDCYMKNKYDKSFDITARTCKVVDGREVDCVEGPTGRCGDGFCTDAELKANNCCEDCNPGPGCGVGPQGKMQQQPMAAPAPYRPPASPQFSMPTEAFGMPSAGLMIGQFSPAMIRPEGISREELLLHKYTRYIERYVSSDAEQYCDDIPGLVEKATATLKERAPKLLDITKMCSTIKKQADKCDRFAPQICEQMKKQSGCGEDVLTKCKSEMKKYLGQFADSGQAQSQCEQQWNFRARSCMSNIPASSCDRSQFVGDCIKNYMANCRGQPQPVQTQVVIVQTPTNCPPETTLAVSPNGDCGKFPNRCDVPGDWKIVRACPIATVTPIPTSTPIRVCAAVITPAVSPTGECKNFATPCDVPGDWKAVSACPAATSTATPTTAPTQTATPAATTTATATPTPTATTVPTTAAPTPTTTIQTAPGYWYCPFPFCKTALAQEDCSLQRADDSCSKKWDEQSRYANCGQVRESCDKEAFMKSCREEISRGKEKYLNQIDTQCQDRYENEKLRIEMMCSEMEDRIEMCNEQSKLACDDLDEEYDSCIALAPKKQEKLQEAVQNIARDMCQFSKYKPKLVQERVEDLSPSATIPVAVAVKEKLSENQLSQLKKVIVSLGEPNRIGNLVIYKAKIRAENFNDLKKLSFVLDAQLDSIARSVEAVSTQAVIAAKKSELAPDVPTTIAALEAVKQSVSEDFQPLVSAQEGKIADSADSVTKIEEDIGSRGLAYKLKWLLGMAADSETKDSEKLSGEAKNLAASEESLKKIAEQISDLSTKAALLEQAKEIGTRRAALEKMSADKKSNSAGILSFLKVFGGG